ncbi:PCYCGC motif-containing (lipo)protein [Solibacillus sp. CAU 1738]|uniref:PCYCGC motif-containing (lipo)protein n=1 Tax=Solibacillus sp. CAU 1738 TaxID=3140363 RepID=UPI0032602050
MKYLYTLLAAILLLSACSNKEQANEEHAVSEHAGHEYESIDIQEKTAGIDVLPSFLDNQPENIRLTYQVAGHATDILEWMPCYCGCGESVGHGSNLNCFIKEMNEDGSVVWDDHGTRCVVCLEIALQSAKMFKDGMELKDIRNAIDEMYKEGYAEPTKTKMPA